MCECACMCLCACVRACSWVCVCLCLLKTFKTLASINRSFKQPKSYCSLCSDQTHTHTHTHTLSLSLSQHRSTRKITARRRKPIQQTKNSKIKLPTAQIAGSLVGSSGFCPPRTIHQPVSQCARFGFTKSSEQRRATCDGQAQIHLGWV